MHVRSFLCALFLLLIALPFAVLRAGGPLQATGERPVVWDIANAGPVTLTLDRGSLGQFDSAAAYDIVNTAVSRWDTTANGSVDFRIGGYLNNDVVSVLDPIISGSFANSDGIIPVIYDNDASITDALLGAGASARVLGFAIAFSADNVTFTDGRVVINGSNQNRGEQRYITTLTHELGHLLGLGHSQSTMRAVVPIMYPSSVNGDLHPDDIAAIGTLYPSEAFTSTVGSISGHILDVDGNPISGIDVMAVDSATGIAFMTLSDYFSGGFPRFFQPPSKSGSYHISGLPPGTYYIRVEGINPEHSSGSSVGSYDPPVNYEVIREWYNGPNESGAMLIDDMNEKTGVRVKAGADRSGIDIVLNDLTGIESIKDFQDNGEASYGVPQTYQGVRANAYAVRFTAPESGSPTYVRFKVQRFASLPVGGEAIVTVYRNKRTSEGDVPGVEIGSVRVPFADIATNQLDDIWLYGLGKALGFAKGEIFHVGLTTAGTGRLDLIFDKSEGESTTTYLDKADSEWHGFPLEGNNGGVRSGNLLMEVGYSRIPAGTSRVLVASNADPLTFDSVEVGASQTKTAVIRNIGTTDYRIDAVSLAGADAGDFSIGNTPTLPATIAPGSSFPVEVTSMPSTEGVKNAQLELQGTVTASTGLVGFGKQSSIQPLLSDIDFGQRLIGVAARIDTFALVHRGATQFAVSAAFLNGGEGFRIVTPSHTVILKPGDSLEFVVEFNPAAKQAYSGEIGFTFLPARDTVKVNVTGTGVDEITGVSEGYAESGTLHLMSLLPNPADRTVELVVGNGTGGPVTAGISVVDVTGRTVIRREVEIGPSSASARPRLSVQGLAAGLYYVVLNAGGDRSIRQLLIVR